MNSSNTEIFADRLNTLYAYDHKDDQKPYKFWLLSKLKDVIQLDSHDHEFLLELAFDEEMLIFKFASQSDLDQWMAMLKKAADFDSSNYFTGETVTDIKEVFVAIDSLTLMAFIMEPQGQINKQGFLLISDLSEVTLNLSVSECTLVSLS